MATSRILGPDGQPIKMPDLQEPQTARLAHLQRELQTHPTRGITPSRLAKILDAARLLPALFFSFSPIIQLPSL